MQANIGDIVDGKVTGLTSFGAFIKLTTGDVGMVHISEVATAYVNDIKDYLSEGQEVKVKVLGVNDTGKINLSIKQANPEGSDTPKMKDRESDKRAKQPPRIWQKPPKYDKQPETFEDMMARFKQTSDEKQRSLKKSDSRKGGSGRSKRR